MDLELDLKLSPSQQEELGKIMEQEKAKAILHAQALEYTDVCWERCVTKIKPKLDKSEEVCIASCVNRFVDTTFLVVESLGAQKKN